MEYSSIERSTQRFSKRKRMQRMYNTTTNLARQRSKPHETNEDN